MSFSLRVLVDEKVLYMSTDNIPFKNLSIRDNILKSSKNIYQISITKDLVILTTEYAPQSESDQSPSTSLNKIITNNIDAYDWDGNHLWNIADVVGNLEIPFWGGTVTTKELVKPYVNFDKSHGDIGDLFSCTAGNFLYIIDLNNRKVLQTIETK